MGGVDLHIHSNCSDGSASPCEIARQALGARLECVSLTDHGVVHGLRELRRHLEGSPVEVIDGVELTADTGEVEEIHILGYRVDTRSTVLLERLREVARLKRQQIARMVEGLQRQGVELSVEDVEGMGGEARSPGPAGRAAAGEGAGYVGRPALAQALVDKGVVRTRAEAFRRYLAAGGSAYVPLGAMSPAECVALIHEAGGLAVLAHPSIEQLDAWVEELVEVGLDGVEAYRPAVGGNQELYAEMVARDFGLLVTGGSDWHGRDSDLPLGSFSVPKGRLSGFFARLAARPGG